MQTHVRKDGSVTILTEELGRITLDLVKVMLPDSEDLHYLQDCIDEPIYTAMKAIADEDVIDINETLRNYHADVAWKNHSQMLVEPR